METQNRGGTCAFDSLSPPLTLSLSLTHTLTLARWPQRPLRDRDLRVRLPHRLLGASPLLDPLGLPDARHHQPDKIQEIIYEVAGKRRDMCVRLHRLLLGASPLLGRVLPDARHHQPDRRRVEEEPVRRVLELPNCEKLILA